MSVHFFIFNRYKVLNIWYNLTDTIINCFVIKLYEGGKI